MNLLNTLRHYRQLRKKRLAFRKQVQSSPQEELKLIVGAGGDQEAGWLASDLPLLDITSTKNWTQLFNLGTLNCITSEHVWEHLPFPDGARAAAQNCYRFLQKGGNLRVAVPDGNHPDDQYREWVRPGGNGPGADDHQTLYTIESIKHLFEGAGFKVHGLEYWTQTGDFIKNPIPSGKGEIARCHDRESLRNDRPFLYTSLIIDCEKL
ncbi:MAG: hypothetical protein SynsKO_31410 [Synoicihabitans sp.]